MGDDERRRALLALVEMRLPVEEARERLARFPWDAPQPLVRVEARHVARVLARYLDGEASAAAVEAWADALEGREDVALADDAVGEALFALANPALEGPLTAGRARRMLAALGA